MKTFFAAALGFGVAFLLGFTSQTTPPRAPSVSGTGSAQVYIHDPYVGGAVPSGIPNVTGKSAACNQSEVISIYDDGGSVGVNCLTLTQPAGASGTVQYNNSSAFGAVTNVTTDGANLQYSAVTTHPAPPTPDKTTLYSYEAAAGQAQTLFKIDNFMGVPVPVGLSGGPVFAAVGTTATWMSECHVLSNWGATDLTGDVRVGAISNTMQLTGSAGQVNWASTSFKTRQRVLGAVSAGSSNSSAGARLAAFSSWRGDVGGAGGFVLWQRAYIMSAHNAQRFFAGIANTTGALTAAAEPSATLNTVYFGCDNTEANLQVRSNDGSGSASIAFDLGANFPCHTNGAGYDFYLAAPPNDGGTGTVSWAIVRLDSAQSNAGIITSDLPVNTVQLAPQVIINNGPDAGAVTARIDWGGMCIMSNW